ncbi:MAG: hypothetical protein WBJ81_02255 [Rickettsiales bacterium]
MSETCSSVLTIKDYYNSCSISGPWFRASTLPSVFSVGNGGRGMHYSLAFLRTSLQNNGFIDYIKHPLKMAEDFNRKPDLEVSSAEKNELPKVFQGLWLTNPENPKPILKYLSNFIAQGKKLEGYQAIIWTNLSPEKLNELNPILKEENIVVKNIVTLDTEYKNLLDFVISPNKYIKPEQNSNYNGLLIDVAKYLILENKGGILADSNFEFDNNFELKNFNNIDFTALYKGNNFIENGFLVAKPHHLIAKELLNIIDEMLNNPDCALNNLRDLGNMDTITFLFSMMPLSMAYMKYNNLENNVDALVSSTKIKKPKEFDVELLEQVQNFENKSYLLEADNFVELTEYVDDYLSILSDLESYTSPNCLGESIGRDNNLSMTWWGAAIVE